MKRTDELKEMLDKLKAESGSAVSGAETESVRPQSGFAYPQSVKRDLPALKVESQRPERIYNQRFNVIWSENKETLLFGLLVSVIMSTLGLLGRQETMILAGVAAFVLFSLLSFMAFFRYISAASSAPKAQEDLTEKLAFLEKKAESFSRREAYQAGPAEERLSEVEGKLEELRLIVKTIAQKRG